MKMAGNDGTTTGLFTGWSSVVHQPCEEPEESELPSTVDMAAFTTGLSVDTNNGSQNNDHSDSDSESDLESSNSGSEASQSGSQSEDSSDSDSSSSSQESSSRSPSPEFSVTTSQTNGLRLTIATVRKSTGSPINEKVTTNSKTAVTADSKDTAATTTAVAVTKSGSSSSDSQCSTDSDSDSEISNKSVPVPVSKNNNSSSSVKSAKGSAKQKTIAVSGSRTRMKVVEKKDDGNKKGGKKDTNASPTKGTNSKVKTRQRRAKKMASLPISRGSTYSSSDSDDSDADSVMLASCSLQEIREEDLAAILTDQQECDAFADFECNRNDKSSPQTGDMSGSDMELPQQAVNALIQRTTESSSESESHPLPNPNTLYANSLLQQFVAQTQMLNAPCATIPVHVGSSGSTEKTTSSTIPNSEQQNKVENETIKRRRGRPKKQSTVKAQQQMKNNQEKSSLSSEYCANPNVSPDSGIQNSPDHVASSPEPSLSPNVKAKSVKDDYNGKRSTNGSKAIKCDKTNKTVNNTVNSPETKSKDSHNSNKVSPSGAISKLDRLLCTNTDPVLYPPRRKVGRPPIITRKGPGRPPKQRPNHTIQEVIEPKPQEKDKSNSTKTSSKTKQKNIRPVLTVKNKMNVKNKYTTLKNAKLMHSKHKHKKHKKCKFKILKTVTEIDPIFDGEIEKLTVEFMKSCVIDEVKQPKENVPELFKTKKVSKKRKTTEHNEKKKKKQSVSTTVNKINNSTNEQRLPLKKRHYHLSANDSKTDEIEKKPLESTQKPVVEIKSTKVEKPKTQSETPVPTPKLQNVNNNEYDEDDSGSQEIGTHIDEAIEACINRFVETKHKPVANSTPIQHPVKEEKVNTSITATTPKKRHRLEMANSEKEKVSPTIKLESSVEEDQNKSKVTVESFISELKMKRNLIPKSTPQSTEEIKEEVVKKESMESVNKIPNVVQKQEQLAPVLESTKKKVRKRRAINRTGFPTVKKKKKKPIVNSDQSSPITTNTCDRVPKDGEEYTKFLLRSTEKSEFLGNSPTVLLNNIDKTLDESSSASKWEVMSECDSLPQNERIEFEMDDLKPERMTLRHRDSSPATSVDTRISELSKSKMDDDTDEITLDASIERLRSRLEKKRKMAVEKVIDNLNGYPKRRIRDVSPASSIEPVIERRLREERASASGDEMKKGKKAPRWRKKYLVAGLFSDYYKEDDETARIKRTENAAKSRFNYNPSEHPYGLLPPPYHCGRYLRCRKLPFQLPYDLWWQHTHSQLPGRDIVPSWNYRKIRTNVYNVKISGGACEPQSCNCKPSTNCGDDCINRLVLSECPASHRCQNQKIQRHEWAPGLEKFMTDSKGWGVRTKLPIKTGEFILEYVGEVVSDQEFKERMGTIYVNDNHHYCLHLDGGLVIDGHRMGGDGRFVNHSCQPNCEMQKWSVNGQFRMALFALRDITGGEELTYDYNFSLFNPAEGQECKCGSEMCRGVIGGKSQRVRQLPEEKSSNKHPGRVGRPRKTEAKKKANSTKEVSAPPPPAQIFPSMSLKPMSHQQKCFILEHHCFLLRNLSKVRKVRDRSLSTNSVTRQQTATPTDHSATFYNQLNALQKPRNIRTRRIAQAEDDPELNKTVKMAAVLKHIWTSVTSNKDLSHSFMILPSKRRVPEYYTKISDPIDLSTIQQNIATGVYKTPTSFDVDMNRLFNNAIRYYGHTSEIGINATKLKKIYVETKQQNLDKFQDVLGKKSSFVSNNKRNEEEDIIRCICGIPRDEGLMIQCERCMVWQHTECVKADADAPSYFCEVCVHREVDYEIPMDEFTEHGHRYYMTLMRGDLQLRQGDTVYVLRDIPIPNSDRKHTYDTIGKIEYSELDIFRIERLWKDSKNGKRFAYGHHYLRPHETYHEPTRKFFPNEVMRVPLYEAVPVELIITHCWVMDINTFCKGRPIGAPEEHIYICEYRVDKSARLFSKVSKSKFPICTKTFAFDRFEKRLKISRTYTPHDLDPSLIKPRGRKPQDEYVATSSSNCTATARDVAALTPVPSIITSVQNSAPIIRTRADQKAHLNKILLTLLGKTHTKQVLDVSYLLEGGRRRKKQNESVK